jgi:uncharacterized protein
MDISGEYRIPASRQRVWEALNDPAVLRTCIVGCKQLERVSDNEFAAMVVTKVGPVSATFRGNVTLADLDPPNGYTLTGQGQGGAAGFARMAAKVALAADGNDTVLTYLAQADIGGKLASVGSRLIQSVAKKNADDFFNAFAAHFGGAPMPRAPESAMPAATVMQGAATAMAQPSGTAPAWLVVFGTALGFALGYMVGHFL